ncbi:hypothetical protein ACCO45_008081 [Purpureocillium lilacinum]|uniref:Uncharacterized protein n=1 Tax=Purpureocillium lilacinum TaxID=33203 RepID=A0ACC4DQC8_PURLI
MTRSSPLRRSQFSSPDRGYRSSFLFDERNTELSHRDALAAAQAEHERIREAALRVYELHELKEEHQRILDQERREQERLKAEAEIAAEEKRLQELKAKTIPKPAPPRPHPSHRSRSRNHSRRRQHLWSRRSLPRQPQPKQRLRRNPPRLN